MIPRTPIRLPVGNRLPQGLEFAVDLELAPGNRWSDPQISLHFGTEMDREVTLNLENLLSRMPPDTPDGDRAVILTVDEQGRTTHNAIPDQVYEDIGRQAGDRVRLTRHESGPDLVLPAGSGPLLGVAADQILRGTGARVGVTTALWRSIPDTTVIRFVLTAKDANRLAGPLRNRPTLGIGPPQSDAEPVWRSGRGHSLADLAEHPFVPVPAGANEIRLDLPWGSWSSVVDVSKDTVIPVVLPESVGIPPLRANAEWPSRPCVVVLDEAAPTNYGLGRSHRGTLADHAVPPDKVIGLRRRRMREWEPGDQGHIELEWPGGSRLRFPLRRDGPLGVATENGIRVEPLSHTIEPLWDLLVTAGTLDALTADEAYQLSEGKWEDPVLGLAAAYALQTTHAEVLPTVLRNLRMLEMNYPDLLLLEAFNSIEPQGVNEERLRKLATVAAVPVFRWGVPLARLLATRSSAPEMAEWDRMLARVEARLVTTSIWTAWTLHPAHGA